MNDRSACDAPVMSQPERDEPAPDMNEVPGLDDTTWDAFLGGSLHLCQPKRGYRAGMDSMLLAACVTIPDTLETAGSPVRLLDVGAGVGAIALATAVRLPSIVVTLVENNAALCAIARHNVTANGFGQRCQVVADDVMAPTACGSPALPENGFDITVSNPPFYEAARHRRSPEKLKADAHGMHDEGCLDAWVRYMTRMTRSGGTALMIYQAQGLPALLAAFGSRFGDVTVLPLHPREGMSASRVIVWATKGRKGPFRLLPGVMLHRSGKWFAPEIERVLKSPSPLVIN